MCGISILIKHPSSTAAISAVIPMTRAIRHRGPDDEGYLFHAPSGNFLITGGTETPHSVMQSPLPYCPNEMQPPTGNTPYTLAMGHRRLSILDLSPAGHQPMCSPDFRFWISYNGEVYNYIELRKELESLGHRFITQSDTEVVLHAWQRWGSRCLNRFNGMFAFSIYDHATRTLFAARDRFGVKPLYKWTSPTGLTALASEIKQFTYLPGWEALLDGQRAYDYLNWGVKNHTTKTLFSGIEHIPPGSLLEIPLENPSQTKLTTWYKVTPTPFQGTFLEASQQFEHLLEDAVRIRLRADVDVGSCLSGGLDSSAVVCLMNRLLDKNDMNLQKTFTACTKERKYDERGHAETVVGHTMTHGHYTYPSFNDLFEQSMELTWIQDEPFGSTSMYAQYKVFELVHQSGVKVVLDGQGADEYLAGYPGFFGNYFYDLFREFKWRSLYCQVKASKLLQPTLKPLHLLGNKLLPNPLQQLFRFLLNKPSSYSPWINRKVLSAVPIDPFYDKPNKSFRDQSTLQIFHSSLPMLLHSEDRNSMAHSIESRTPFLDYRLVEFCLGLPNNYKIGEGWTKKILREGLRGTLPESIRMRKDKIGFVTPEEEWACGVGAARFQLKVEDSIEASQGILYPSVRKIAKEMTCRKRPYDFWMWRIICFGEWIKRFSVKIP